MWLLFVGFVAFFSMLFFANRWYRKPYIENFTSKCVFITGTDSGFGQALALRLDNCGVKVYAGCYTKEGAEKLKTLASGKLKTIPIDITKVESVYKAKEAIEKDLGSSQELWGLVNNAGLLNGHLLFPLQSTEDHRLAMEVNFFGTMNVTNAFWPLIKKSTGRIVNVISIGGRISSYMEPYTCSKYALEPYTDGLRRWMSLFGARVCIIEPGTFTATSLTKDLFSENNLDDVRKMKENALPHVDQECGEGFFDAAKKDIKKFHERIQPLSLWNQPNLVTGAMKHALFAKHPKDRYVCGVDATWVTRVATMFPDWFIDFFITITFANIRRTIKTT